MKYVFLLLLFVLLGTGCEEKINYEESLEAGSIQVDGIQDNTINVHTGETFQVKMNVQPSDAKLSVQPQYLFSSGDKQVFTVDANGIVSGITPGESVLYIETSNYEGLKTMAVVSVTDKIYPVAEIKVDERMKNHTIAVGDEIAIGKYIEILPANASNKEYSLLSSNKEVLDVTETGNVKALALGDAVLTIKAKDGSNTAATCNISVKVPVYNTIERTGWEVTTSHKLPVDDAIKNAPKSLIDGDKATCMSMVKPGKSYGGVSVGKDEAIYFILDMKEKTDFNYLKIFHRTSNSLHYLRTWGVSLFGSNDGETFEPIREDIPVEYDGVDDHTIRLTDKLTYRYLKVQHVNWHLQSGSTIQIAEVEMGTYGF